MHNKQLLLIPLALILCANVFAARDHDITMEDYFTQAFLTDCVLSPDGKFAAYTEMRWEPPAEKRNTELWVVETATGSMQRLTFDPARDADPQWSPDSKWIYFTSARGESDDEAPLNGKSQIWRVPVTGGEPFAITRLKDGVTQYELSKDGRTLYYVASNEEVEDEWKDLREKYEDLEYGHGVVNYSQIWKLDLTTWRAEKLIDDKRVIGEFKVSPDEKRIAMITTSDEVPLRNEGWSRVDVWDSATKKVTSLPDKLMREDAPSPYGWLGGLCWSADGRKLAFHEDFDGYPSEILVAVWKGEAVAMQKLKRPNEVSVSGDPRMLWIGKTSELCFIADQRARARVFGITVNDNGNPGASRLLAGGDVVINQISLDASGGKLCVIRGDVTNPCDLYLLTTGQSNKYQQLTHVNPQIDTWKLPQISLVQWIGAEGDSVEGLLELPPEYKPGQKLPMVVELHGGPTDASKFYMEFWIYGRILMSTHGYAVFSPNYRGSTGYGDKFLTGLIGHENDRDVKDILTGVDEMIRRGIADSEKLGVMGWSNGGFLTNCVITKDQRFKAASSGAGVVDMTIQWGIEDTPGHVINYMKGYPWAKADEYRRSSPLYDLDKVKTPTLIHVGGSDPRVPPANARTLYRALHEYVKIPCELIVYPDQGHSVMTYTTRKAKMSWDLAWFDKYILGKNTEEPKKP
jgi:dipeptidyl aminopeptidase/acylaminoacyl peptidase